MRVVATVFGGLVGVLALTWLFQGNDFFLFQFFAPKYEQVRRSTMLQSRAYTEAAQRNLYEMQTQYTEAKTDAEKAALKAQVLNAVEGYDWHVIPPDLQSFISRLRAE